MGHTQIIRLRDDGLYGYSDPRNPDGVTMGYCRTPRASHVVSSGKQSLHRLERGMAVEFVDGLPSSGWHEDSPS